MIRKQQGIAIILRNPPTARIVLVPGTGWNARLLQSLEALLCAAVVAVAMSGLAHAQGSSPFAGTWHGIVTMRIQETCAVGGFSVTSNCVGSTPWSATVDGTGLLNGVEGPATGTCDGETYTETGAYPFSFPVPASGYIADFWEGVELGCALAAQFTTYPSPSVRGSLSNCTFRYSDPASGAVCNGTIFEAAITGTGTPLAFPMTVTANIGPVVSSASASIQYRSEDVGASGSVYTFAVAPATIVKAGPADEPPLTVGFAKSADGAKDSPVSCVLAQLNASGQLKAVSASSLQAYVSGVLSSQGQSVAILNNVSTSNVNGAIFFVGYGPDAAAMLNGNVVNRAVSVPGTVQCNPQPPQKGWWWNPNEGGRGFSIEASNNKLFMATYLYDASGRATWYVAAGPTTLDGSLFSGQLLAFGNGVTLDGPYRPNSQIASAGSVSLAFNDAQQGTIAWPGGAMTIRRYGFGSSGTATAPLANQPESGWWWGGTGDDGRGFFIEWQGNRAFIAGYMYDASGNPVWYVADNTVASASSFSGNWMQFANGQTLTGPYRTPSLVNGNVAPVTIQFQGAESAILSLPYGTLPLTRFRF